MLRLSGIFALLAGSIALGACSSSPFSGRPASQVAPTSSPYAIPGIPQSQFECVTDDGYGRWESCGSKSF